MALAVFEQKRQLGGQNEKRVQFVVFGKRVDENDRITFPVQTGRPVTRKPCFSFSPQGVDCDDGTVFQTVDIAGQPVCQSGSLQQVAGKRLVDIVRFVASFATGWGCGAIHADSPYG